MKFGRNHTIRRNVHFDTLNIYEAEKIARLLQSVKKYSIGLLGLSDVEAKVVPCSCEYNRIYIERAKEVYEILDEQLTKFRFYPEYVEDILVRLDFSILGRSFVENSLKRIIAKLDRNIMMIERVIDVLFEVIMNYEKADSIT